MFPIQSFTLFLGSYIVCYQWFTIHLRWPNDPNDHNVPRDPSKPHNYLDCEQSRLLRLWTTVRSVSDADKPALEYFLCRLPVISICRLDSVSINFASWNVTKTLWKMTKKFLKWILPLISDKIEQLWEEEMNEHKPRHFLWDIYSVCNNIIFHFLLTLIVT